VDLERREVVDLLSDRSATGIAGWLGQHPEVEIISRDRSGLYAQGGREGAPQARQIADRFHLLQNLREAIEAQLSRVDRPTGRALLPPSKDEDENAATIFSSPHGQSEVAEHRTLTKQTHRRSRQAIFDQIRSLREAGTSIRDIAKETGFGPRSIRKWLKFSAPPERRAVEPTPCSPNYFQTYLAGRWAEGCMRGRKLFHEIKLRGYTGSFSHLERLLTNWRSDRRAKAAKANKINSVVTSPSAPQPITESEIAIRG
jgi:transposase